ncbi:hypothetical protein ACFZDG_25975 [Kitasatospora xanthocidica]|uniref:hypothetical protein n=1 Tax=Kitasatospora xanthocidica TaxID=83382 RepID=UPI0036EF796E
MNGDPMNGQPATALPDVPCHLAAAAAQRLRRALRVRVPAHRPPPTAGPTR